MANWSATLATLGALVRPQSLQPSLVVPSIAHLDWHALKHRAHVHAVIIDKDNCIVSPPLPFRVSLAEPGDVH